MSCQGRRYDVYEDIGCYPVVVNVWLAYPLVMAWPLVIGLISAVYCGKSPVYKIRERDH